MRGDTDTAPGRLRRLHRARDQGCPGRPMTCWRGSRPATSTATPPASAAPSSAPRPAARPRSSPLRRGSATTTSTTRTTSTSAEAGSRTWSRAASSTATAPSRSTSRAAIRRACSSTSTPPSSSSAADTDASIDVYQGSSFGGPPKLMSTGPVNGNGPFGAAFERTAKDGLTMVFSTDEQLVAADTDSATDIYQRGLLTDNTTRISAGAVNGNGGFPVRFLDASDGLSRVFFETDEQLVAGDTDSSTDVYERAGGTTSLVSAGEINGNKSDKVFFGGASTDGLRVFFETSEQLVAADTDNEHRPLRALRRARRSGSRPAQVNGNNVAGAHFAGPRRRHEGLLRDPRAARRRRHRHEPATSTGASAATTSRDLGRRDQRQQRQVRRTASAGPRTTGTRVFFATHEKLVAAATPTRRRHLRALGGATRWLSDRRDQRQRPAEARPAAGLDRRQRGSSSTRLEQLVPADTDANTDVYERAANRTNLITPGDAFASISGALRRRVRGLLQHHATGRSRSDVDGTERRLRRLPRSLSRAGAAEGPRKRDHRSIQTSCGAAQGA